LIDDVLPGENDLKNITCEEEEEEREKQKK